MQSLARLAVYLTAVAIVFTARLPDPASTTTALRTTAPDAILDPVRLLIVEVLLVGIVIEFLRRRPVWH